MNIDHQLRQLRPLGTWLVLALLSGHSSLSSDSGLTEVRKLSKREDGIVLIYKHTGDDANSIASQTGALLGKPLDPDATFTIATLDNRSVQAMYARLGIADAARRRGAARDKMTS